MKLLYLNGINIFGNILNGAGVTGKKNFNILVSLFGRENIVPIIINETDEKNVYSLRRHRNKIEYFFNSIMLRGCFNKRTENDICKIAETESVKIAFIEGSIYGRIVERLELMGIRCIVLFHNAEKDFGYKVYKNGGILFYPQYRSYGYNEKKTIECATKCICLNDRDKNRLYELYKRKMDAVIPIALDDVLADGHILLDKEKKDSKKRLLFVGSTELQANVDSIVWFIDKVMPLLDEETELRVVGKGFEKYREKYESDNVRIVGTVDDISREYMVADAVVIPILYGCGMKTKTAEACMYNKMIIASDEALVGYRYESFDGIFCCNTPEEYAKIINGLENSNIMVESREMYLKYYSTDVVRVNFRKVINDTIEICKGD